MSEKKQILVINAGSSSIKFQLFSYNLQEKKPAFAILCKGLVEKIGLKDNNFVIQIANSTEFVKKKIEKVIGDHVTGAKVIIDTLYETKVITDVADIIGIGHRIVHGGQKFKSSIIVDKAVIKAIEDCIALAPLHNPAALKGLASFQKVMPQAQNVVVFDTSFHTTIPEEKHLYPVPYEWYKDYQVKKYGFHGISYRYILTKLKLILNKPQVSINAIVCHLGNGASICAIKDGKSYNTSMGLTPLDGLMMSSRSGSIDPSIHNYMCTVKSNTNIAMITNDLNKTSGLLGISQCTSDLRDVLAVMNDKKHSKHVQATLAIKMFVQRIANYIIQYANDLTNNIDALVFTAGIGENSAIIRSLVIKEITLLNLKLDETNNNNKYDDYVEISTNQSQVPIYKIRTNEEIMICQDTYHLLTNNE